MIETEEEIRKALNLEPQESLEHDLYAKGYAPFATITTVREKYKKEGFGLDFDSVDFGFEIGEIELMVNDVSEMEEAMAKIKAFAERHQLGLTPVHGKVVEYICLNRPAHCKALKDAGIIS